MPNEDVLLKIAADVASALQAMEQISDKVVKLVDDVKGVGEGAEDADQKTQGFWDRFLENTTKGSALGAAFGIQLSKAFDLVVDGIGNAVKALPQMVLQQADVADGLRDMSFQTDVSVETLSKLRFVASQTGTSLETIARTIFDMGRRVAEGGDAIKKALGDIGLRLEDVRKMKPEDAFVAILEALGRLPTAAERSAAGIAIFGGKFRTIANLTKEDIRGLLQQAEELGLTISTKTANQADEFNDALDVMSKMIDATKGRITAALLPALTSIAQAAPAAGGALLLVGQNALSVTASFATIASGIAPMLLGFSGAVKWVSSLGNTIPILTARVWLLDASQKAVAISTALMTSALGATLIVVGALTAVVAAGYQAWQLYKESQERAASADRQAVVDQANLARIIKATGREFKTLEEAVAFVQKG